MTSGATLRKILLTLLGTSTLLAGCATVVLPPNVKTTSPGGGNPYMDQVDFSYTRSAPITFNQLKLCVAQTVQNNEVSLGDSSGSFVGAYTGNYYRSDRRQTVAGGQVFKYVDDPSATLIASGNTETQPNGLVTDYVRFDVKASAQGNRVGLTFLNLARAQRNTGALSNDGFGPIVIAPGSRADTVYASLDQVAQNLKACVGP